MINHAWSKLGLINWVLFYLIFTSKTHNTYLSVLSRMDFGEAGVMSCSWEWKYDQVTYGGLLQVSFCMLFDGCSYPKCQTAPRVRTFSTWTVPVGLVLLTLEVYCHVVWPLHCTGALFFKAVTQQKPRSLKYFSKASLFLYLFQHLLFLQQKSLVLLLKNGPCETVDICRFPFYLFI